MHGLPPLQCGAIGEGSANLAVAVQEINKINKRAPGIGAIVALGFILAGPVARWVAFAIGVWMCSPKGVADLGLACHVVYSTVTGRIVRICGHTAAYTENQAAISLITRFWWPVA